MLNTTYTMVRTMIVTEARFLSAIPTCKIGMMQFIKVNAR